MKHPIHRSGAFTLVELLTVVAIIGILAAIIIPTAAGARNSAKRAETKVRFSQWAAAMEQFRQEYGYYPAIDKGTGRIDPERFAGALTGHDLSGSAFSNTTSDVLCGNKKLISFYSISEAELDQGRATLVDAFGNAEIAVLYDKNGDGRISNLDGPMVMLHFADGSAGPSPEDVDLSRGVHATVLFYSPGRGTTSSDIVYSWK